MTSEHYKRGYDSGLNWIDNYRPGGPYAGVMKPGTIKARKDWLEGFDAAIAARGLFFKDGKLVSKGEK